MKEDLKTILSIDDDTDLQECIKLVLESHGYKILCAGNGKEAIELLQSLPPKNLPHLILLDYQMPILDGFEFNELKMKNPRFANIPVVLMTSSSDLWPIMEQIDAEAYVNKPIQVESIIKLAQNFVNRREVARVSFLA